MRLGVTRSADKLGELVASASKRSIEIVPIPLISLNPIEFEWPPGLDLDKIDWLFFGSANGVKSFFERAKSLGRSLPESIHIGCVGDRTAKALSGYGRQPDLIPTQSYGERMFNEFVGKTEASGKTVVYARAEAVNYDPAAILAGAGAHYFPIVCYESEVRQVDRSVIEPLESDDHILFTAPSTVRAYHTQFGKPVAKTIAIGHTTAAAMNDANWTGVITMEKPDVARVLEYI